MPLTSISDPQVYSIICYMIAGFSLPIHLFGAYCILFKTPEIMHSTKWALFNLHFWSSTLDLSLSLFAQPIFCSPTFSGYPLGVLKWVGVPTEVLVLVISTIFMLVPISIILMFENRYFILFVTRGPWRYLRYPFLIINYIIGITVCIPAYLNIPKDQDNVRRILFDMYPQACEHITDKSKIIVMSLVDNTSAIQNSLTLLVLIEIIVFAVLLRVKMNRAIKNIHSSAVSRETLKKQKRFINALKLQIAIPIAIIFIPAAGGAILASQSSTQQGVDNLLNLITSVHGVLSTILMVYLQKPYREVFRSMFCGSRKPVEMNSPKIFSASKH